MTQRKIKPGKELGAARCRSIATDDATLSRLYFSRAAKAVAQRVILDASKPFTGRLGPLSRPLLPKITFWAIPGVSIYEFTA
ncbi:MAG: hypothetical protein AAF562_07370 [Pseudomonadota bacterium]